MTRDATSHALSSDALSADLNTIRVGRRITVLPEVDSTNGYALDVIGRDAGEASDGHVVFAEYQTAGRGRLGRVWTAPRCSSLTFTVLLWEESARFRVARTIMSASLAVAVGVEKSTEIEPLIHWPNDVYIRDKKLAGILVEARACGDRLISVAVGIGVNCLQHPGHFPPELRDRATSLEIESRHPVDRLALARSILRELDRFFGQPAQVGDEEIAAMWRARSADLGQRVTLICDGQSFAGRVLEVNPQSGLLLQLDTGGRREFDLATISRA